MLWSNRRMVRESVSHALGILSNRYRVDIFPCGEACLYCQVLHEPQPAGTVGDDVLLISGGERNGKLAHVVQREVDADMLDHDRAYLMRLVEQVKAISPLGAGLDLLRQTLERPVNGSLVQEAFHLGSVASALQQALALETA